MGEGMGDDQELFDPREEANEEANDAESFTLTAEQEDAAIYAATFGTIETDLYYRRVGTFT